MNAFAQQYVIDHNPYTQVYLVKDVRNHAFAFALENNVNTNDVMLAIGRELLAYYLEETKKLRNLYVICRSLKDEPIEDMKELASLMDKQYSECLLGDNAPVELAKAYLINAISDKISDEFKRRSSIEHQ